MRTLPVVLLACLVLPGCADDAEDVADDSDSFDTIERRGPGDDPPDPPPDDICDDGNECTVDWRQGGRCRYRAVDDGTWCDDGNQCNGVSTCQAGACVASAPPSCDDGNVCTDDACEPSTGCVHSNNTASCSDGLACTVGDVCSAGVCDGAGSSTGTVGWPSITGVFVSAPGGVIDRAPVYYLEGNELDVDLNVPSCTYVTRVVVGTSTLTTAPRTACGEFDWPRDCEPQHYSIESDVLAADGSRQLRVRLHLSPGDGTGASQPVRIVAASALGEAFHDLTLSRVADVAPSMIGLSIAEADLHNAFVASTYADYGDDGRQTLASGTTTYDPDYNATWMAIEAENRLHVSLDFSAAVDNWCNPRIHVDARYQLGIDEDTVTATRLNDLTTVTTEFAWYCDLLGGWFQGIKAGMAEDAVVDAVDAGMGGLAGRLQAALCQEGDNGCVGVLLQSVPGDLRIRVLNPEIAVAIDVPYDPNRAKFPSPYGLPLRAGENVVLAAEGIVAGCDGATLPSQTCWGVAMGPAGVPNRTVATGPAAPPVPEENVWDGTQWQYFGERAEARAELRMLGRNASALPRPDQPIGMLVGKLATTGAATVAIGTGPCQVTTPSATLLGMGGNDRTASGYDYGRGKRRISVVFVEPTAALPACN